MRNVISDREIRVGVLGAFRGRSFAKTAESSGMMLACVCDNFGPRLDAVCAEMGVPGHLTFDEMLKQDIDAVVIAAPFNQHAPFAIQALRAGKHVLSETSCNVTLAEGVELYRTVEETGLCYMLAENYCYTRFSQEFKRLYEAGEIGQVRYAEGEYNHPMDVNDALWYAPGTLHWRNHLPGCYYNTHALAPLMYITDTLPVAVSCSLIPQTGGTEIDRFKRDGYVMLIRMDNGAIFRLYGDVAGHSCAYSLHGTTGAMECVRGHGYYGPEQVRVWHEPWDLKPGQVEEQTYYPNWPSHAKQANETGHGGGDFFVEHAFASAIKRGVQPYLDAYRGIMMTNVGILGWRSAHQGGAFLPVPDLRDADAQNQMLTDRLCPFPGLDNTELMPLEMRTPRPFTPEIVRLARVNWKLHGYTDDEIEALLNQQG